MARVFVINQPVSSREGYTYDVSPAMQYGGINFIYRADDPLPSVDPTFAVVRAHDVLQDANPNDYFVWAGGDPFGMVVAIAVASEYLDGVIRYLRWDRGRDEKGRRTSRVGFYSPILVDRKEGAGHE